MSAAVGLPQLAPDIPVIVYSDGASRGNPGLSGAGWIIEAPSAGQSFAGNMFLGTRTNNEAEYLAAAMGLQAAYDMQARQVTLRADSELLVRQLQGRYKVRNARILPLFTALRAVAQKFARFEVEHVRREFNARADEQANLAIDSRASNV